MLPSILLRMSVRGAAASRVYESVKRDLLDGQIQPGQKIADGVPQEAIRNPEVERAYLGE